MEILPDTPIMTQEDSMSNMENIRDNFPLYKSDPTVAYLDSAASTQTAQVVIEAMNGYYENYRSNIHRGMYPIAAKATEQYEQARATIAEYLNASSNEIVFTSGTTEGLNMLARGLGRNVWKGNNVVLTKLEHHANLVPWQQAAKEFGFELRFIEITSDGKIDLGAAKEVIDEKTSIVSFCSVSNALGTIVPVEEIVALAKKHDAITVIDAAQSAGHEPIDVKKWDCDFLVLSGHKVYGPTGIGVLYGKKERLEQMDPVSFGGDMIETVTYEDATWAPVPEKFEAGTPNIAGAIGMATALVYLNHLRWENIQKHEDDLKKYLVQKLQKEVDIVGPQLASERAGVVSFTIPGAHPHDIADILGKSSVCIRAGHHCAMPLMQQLGVSGTARVSLGVYNTRIDVDRLMTAIAEVKELFQK